MKIALSSTNANHGSAVITVMGMIAIMMILLTVNLATVRTVDRELKLVEKKQVERLKAVSEKSNPAAGRKTNNLVSP